MMNDDMLRNIEYLREKADVSYEEAGELLERYDGNVMRVLVELERQGRVFPNSQAAQAAYEKREEPKRQASEAKEKATGFIKKAFQHRLVIESGSGEGKETVANLSAPYCAGAAIVAPHLAVASVALMFVMGYRVRVRKEKVGDMPDNVDEFVDKTVSNIKKTASSLQDTVRSATDRSHKNDGGHGGSTGTGGNAGTVNTENQNSGMNHNNDDPSDHDEGGEITVE